MRPAKEIVSGLKSAFARKVEAYLDAYEPEAREPLLPSRRRLMLGGAAAAWGAAGFGSFKVVEAVLSNDKKPSELRDILKISIPWLDDDKLARLAQDYKNSPDIAGLGINAASGFMTYILMTNPYIKQAREDKELQIYAVPFMANAAMGYGVFGWPITDYMTSEGHIDLLKREYALDELDALTVSVALYDFTEHRINSLQPLIQVNTAATMALTKFIEGIEAQIDAKKMPPLKTVPLAVPPNGPWERSP